MDAESTTTPEPKTTTRSKVLKFAAMSVVCVLVVYFVAAYLIVPALWQEYARRHPSFDDNPRITKTGDGHPGDPLNVGLIGSQAEITAAMTAAGWYAADHLGLRSDLKIAADTVLEHSYDRAPVSNLFLFGRKEDLAFEMPVGDNPRQRHHVRFWKTPHTDAAGREQWLGSASYDDRVGLSHTTGQITHHIAANVDQERAKVATSLTNSGKLWESYTVPQFHSERTGLNGGGDRWTTDGSLWVGLLAH